MSNFMNQISNVGGSIKKFLSTEVFEILETFLDKTKGMTGPQSAVIGTTIAAGSLVAATAIREVPLIIEAGVEGEICGKKFRLNAPHHENDVPEEEK